MKVSITSACGVGSNMGEHKGIGRNLCLMAEGRGTSPTFLSFLQEKRITWFSFCFKGK